MTTSEIEPLRQGARASGLQLGAYARRLLIGGKQRPVVIPEVNRQAWREAARLAANLNQVNAVLHSNRGFSALPAMLALRPTVERLAGQVALLRMQMIGVGGRGDDDEP